jgi:hypothetical protein
MTGQRLAICDGDSIYCHRLDEYLHGNLKLDFDIFSFTDPEILAEFANKTPVSLLIISGKLFDYLEENGKLDDFKNVLVLDETAEAGRVDHMADECGVRIVHMSKYQEASRIVDSIIDFCVKSPEDFKGVGNKTGVEKGHIYGFYTPISGCGQTDLAISIARKLAQKSKVIFLSFESFSFLPEMLGVSPREDITDVIYYTECEKSKLPIYLEKIKETKDGIDFILPARTAQQIKDISFEKIKDLADVLIHEAGYEYVVMDLTEYPAGFLDILMLCDKVFTITGTGSRDTYRQKLYDEALVESGYGGIKAKTVFCQLPDNPDKKAFEKYGSVLAEREAV